MTCSDIVKKFHIVSFFYCSGLYLNTEGDLNIQGVTGGTDQTSGECFLGHTIPI